MNKRVNSKKQQLQHFESAGAYKLLVRPFILTINSKPFFNTRLFALGYCIILRIAKS
jgi:hypothetical protein